MWHPNVNDPCECGGSFSWCLVVVKNTFDYPTGMVPAANRKASSGKLAARLRSAGGVCKGLVTGSLLDYCFLS